jgi:hypothetical protein
MPVLILKDFFSNSQIRVEYNSSTCFYISETETKGTFLIVMSQNEEKFEYCVCEKKSKIIRMLEIGLH